MDLQRSTSSGEQVHYYNTVTNPADRVVCSYPNVEKLVTLTRDERDILRRR